jgi:hypothetical protein
MRSLLCVFGFACGLMLVGASFLAESKGLQVGPVECTTSAGSCSLYGPNGVDGAYCCTSTFPLKALAHVGPNAVPLGWNLQCANMFQEFDGVCAVPVCNSCCGGQAVSTGCDDPLA